MENGVWMRQKDLRSGLPVEGGEKRWVPEAEIGPALAQGWRECAPPAAEGEAEEEEDSDA